MYQGTLTDRDKGETIKFRDKSIFEVMTHFSMLIEDCDLEKVQIKIVKKPKLKGKYILNEGESSCCGASVYENTDICTACKEHCETIAYEDEE